MSYDWCWSWCWWGVDGVWWERSLRTEAAKYLSSRPVLSGGKQWWWIWWWSSSSSMMQWHMAVWRSWFIRQLNICQGQKNRDGDYDLWWNLCWNLCTITYHVGPLFVFSRPTVWPTHTSPNTGVQYHQYNITPIQYHTNTISPNTGNVQRAITVPCMGLMHHQTLNVLYKHKYTECIVHIQIHYNVLCAVSWSLAIQVNILCGIVSTFLAWWVCTVCALCKHSGCGLWQEQTLNWSIFSNLKLLIICLWTDFGVFGEIMLSNSLMSFS